MKSISGVAGLVVGLAALMFMGCDTTAPKGVKLSKDLSDWTNGGDAKPSASAYPVTIAWRLPQDNPAADENIRIHYSVPASFTSTTARIALVAETEGEAKSAYLQFPIDTIKLTSGNSGDFDMSDILKLCNSYLKMVVFSKGGSTIRVALFQEAPGTNSKNYANYFKGETIFLRGEAAEAYDAQISNGLKLARPIK